MKFIGAVVVVLFAGCVVSTAEEAERWEAEEEIIDDAIVASDAAMGEPRTDAQLVCLHANAREPAGKGGLLQVTMEAGLCEQRSVLGGGEQRVASQVGGLLSDHGVPRVD